MYTANPTTGAAFSFHKLSDCPLDMIFSSFRFFGGDNPANPLIAR
jgi:hypothetical protein